MPFHISERLFCRYPMLFWYLDNVSELLRQMNTVWTFVENIVKKIAKEKPKNGRSSILRILCLNAIKLVSVTYGNDNSFLHGNSYVQKYNCILSIKRNVP